MPFPYVAISTENRILTYYLAAPSKRDAILEAMGIDTIGKLAANVTQKNGPITIDTSLKELVDSRGQQVVLSFPQVNGVAYTQINQSPPNDPNPLYQVLIRETRYSYYRIFDTGADILTIIPSLSPGTTAAFLPNGVIRQTGPVIGDVRVLEIFDPHGNLVNLDF
jgi:hypothetical protein